MKTFRIIHVEPTGEKTAVAEYRIQDNDLYVRHVDNLEKVFFGTQNRTLGRWIDRHDGDQLVVAEAVRAADHCRSTDIGDLVEVFDGEAVGEPVEVWRFGQQRDQRIA